MTESQALYRHLGFVETHRGGESGFLRIHFAKPVG
jgi:hypothetical protein